MSWQAMHHAEALGDVHRGNGAACTRCMPDAPLREVGGTLDAPCTAHMHASVTAKLNSNHLIIQCDAVIRRPQKARLSQSGGSRAGVLSSFSTMQSEKGHKLLPELLHTTFMVSNTLIYIVLRPVLRFLTGMCDTCREAASLHP